MKRYALILLTVVFLASIVVAVNAGHIPMQYPYEGILYGYASTMPLPAGGDVRQHIVSHDPYKQWETWPSKMKMKPGTQPHGSLVTVYINSIASDSIKTARDLDNNSIIIKENYTSDKKLKEITVMYKVKGYNPEGGDWFWVKYDPKLKIVVEGKANKCIACHSKVKSNDYIFMTQ